ncbi:unnamed protein product [Wuchereria bancrofti]|uniref:Uncharacterized protein n=1 Tax=Wuchereria bancrofti TaxID=6293 RepID=A0A3P7EJ03_WUCBA|nr:unnamed protein product [Wuchereria bancrofti]
MVTLSNGGDACLSFDQGLVQDPANNFWLPSQEGGQALFVIRGEVLDVGDVRHSWVLVKNNQLTDVVTKFAKRQVVIFTEFECKLEGQKQNLEKFVDLGVAF